MSVRKVLFADSAGSQWQRAFHTSSYALAGFLPAGLVSPEGGVLAKVSDIGLAAAIPLHTHVGLNYGAPLWRDPWGPPPTCPALWFSSPPLP